MNNFDLMLWHDYLRYDFNKLIQKSPFGIKQALLGKSARLIEDDFRGYKLCLAAALTCGLQLPAINRRTLRQLHLLYLCSWLSYEIYDNINDGETGVQSLPIANFSLLMSLELSRGLIAGVDYQKILLAYLKEMESANYEELHWDISSPYPEDLLFKRSSGQLFALHVLSDEWKLHQLRRQQLINLMQLVISVLQIQDDLRDYFPDYLSARKTLVNQYLFQQNFVNQMEVKIFFYQNILPKILDKLELLIHQARSLLVELTEFNVQDGFFKFILSSCEKILANDRSKSVRFSERL